MPVPESVRKVQRPVNTIVEDSGRDSPYRYSVRERAGEKYVQGGNPRPSNGRVIGHIIDGVYVPKNAKPGRVLPEMLSYGAAAFAHSVSQDIYADLLAVFEPGTACAVMAAAAVRVIRPKTSSSRMASAYGRTFASKFWPGASLSSNSIGKLFKFIGESSSLRRAFFAKRVSAVEKDHHIAVDGMLKQDGSTVNDLSAFSRKSRVTGRKEISVLYAYDLEKLEPVCAEVFPGNVPDSGAYAGFIRDNDIKSGIIVSDKGFPPSCIEEELKKRPGLHFFTPLRRTDARIADNAMLSFEGVLPGVDGQIMYSKRQIKGGRFLYAFRDPKIAAEEEYKFLLNRRKNDDFSQKKYEKASKRFGLIVYESDADLEPCVAYACYDDRWQIEMVFDSYKNDLCLDRTGVQGDFSVMGSEFVNFVSTLMTCRMLRKATRAGLLDKCTWGDLIDDLSQAWRDTDAPLPPASSDGHWMHVTGREFTEMETLGLSKADPKPESKKRRLKTQKPEDFIGPKRHRGRPRKHPLPEQQAGT